MDITRFVLNLKVNIFALTEFHKTEKVTFYSVKLDGATLNETEKFIEKYEESEHKEFLFEIVSLIHQIGERGALGHYFNRRENDFTALPPKGQLKEEAPNFQGESLRLYCLRLSESVVLLFNGGVKDGKTAQESSCSTKFYEASSYTKKIREALFERTIEIQNGLILDYNGNTEISL